MSDKVRTQELSKNSKVRNGKNKRQPGISAEHAAPDQGGQGKQTQGVERNKTHRHLSPAAWTDFLGAHQENQHDRHWVNQINAHKNSDCLKTDAAHALNAKENQREDHGGESSRRQR